MTLRKWNDMLKAESGEASTCAWTKDPDFELGDTYNSACGEKWSFIDGGPAENRVRYCHWCGRPVKAGNVPPVHTTTMPVTAKG